MDEHHETFHISSHTELVICPECSITQPTEVVHSWPWYSYVHTCVKCGYVIMESEWQEVEE